MADEAKSRARLAVLAAVAMADGSLDPAERALLESICDNLGLGRNDLAQALAQPRSICLEELPKATAEKRELLVDVFRVAAADGRVGSREEKMARKVAAALGLKETDLQQCLHIARNSLTGAEQQSAKATEPGTDSEQAVPAEWNVGDVILDLYEVRKVHHGGGMGLVYQVHHRDWNMDLAVKSPRVEYFRTPAHKENFVRECLTWVGLGLHPHIVCCYYVRVLGGVPRVFAEYVEGGSLKDWIDSRKLYEGGEEEALKRMLDVAIQFAWGLHYAHEQGLVHQDVKPANLLMTPEGIAKVTDFGLAKARAVAGEAVQADSGQSVLVSSGGMTPAYCSPEQANKQPLSRKTDIWSWGLSVLEMFAGEVFWRSGQAAPEALNSYLEMGAETELIPRMPDDLATLLKQCFRWDPQQRPDDMSALADESRRICQRMTAQSYARPEPRPVRLLADAMNNKAMSLLDLGQQQEAEAVWDAAIRTDPHHWQAIYNRAILQWQSGRTTDQALLQDLEAVRGTTARHPELEYHLGLVHLERMDIDSAVAALEIAARSDSLQQAQSRLQQAHSFAPYALRCLATLGGHKNRITSISISADGSQALSASTDKTLRLWQLPSGHCLRTVKHDATAATSVSLSSDGQWAVSGGDDYKLRVWDISTGRCIRALKAGHWGAVVSVVLCAESRFALSGCMDLVNLWDVTRECIPAEIKGHTRTVNSVCWTTDRRWALSGSDDKTLRLWDVQTHHCARIFEGHAGSVNYVCLTPNGRQAISASSDNTLKVWDVLTGACLRTLEGHSSKVNTVCLSKDGLWALSGGAEGVLRLWELSSGRCLRTLKGHTEGVTAVAISRDGDVALSGSDDATLLLWRLDGLKCPKPWGRLPVATCRVQSSEQVGETQQAFDRLVQEAEVSLAAGGYTQTLQLLSRARKLPGYDASATALNMWNQAGLHARRRSLRNAWCRRTFPWRGNRANSIRLSPDCRWMLAPGEDPLTLCLWDLSTGRCQRTWSRFTGPVTSISINAPFIRAASGEGTLIRLWDLISGSCLHEFTGHQKQVLDVALTPDGNRILSSSEDGTLRLWETDKGHCLWTTKEADVKSIAVSSDGRFALSTSGEMIPANRGMIRVWDLSSGQCLTAFKGYVHAVNSLSLSRNSRYVLGSCGATLRLWDVREGHCLQMLEGSGGSVMSARLSTDARWAVSGGSDKLVRVWELAHGRCLRTLEGHTARVVGVDVSMDGRWLVSASYDGTIRFWELDWDFETVEPADWDKGARLYLETFLTLRVPAQPMEQSTLPVQDAPPGHSSRIHPTWTEEQFGDLLHTLACAGYGWLQPEGVRNKLEEMVANWTGPPPLPGAK